MVDLAIAAAAMVMVKVKTETRTNSATSCFALLPGFNLSVV